jgi:iron transport multicopper oxidase
LSSSFDVNAPAQSREFNWTLSEIISDPAGTSKNMLVVNGISPGPTVEANIGDRSGVRLMRLISR